MLGRAARPAVTPAALQTRSRLKPALRSAELIAALCSRGDELPRLGYAGEQFDPAQGARWVCLASSVDLLRSRLSPGMLFVVNQIAGIGLLIYGTVAFVRSASL